MKVNDLLNEVKNAQAKKIQEQKKETKEKKTLTSILEILSEEQK